MGDPEWFEMLSALSRIPNAVLTKPRAAWCPDGSTLVRSASCGRRAPGDGRSRGEQVSSALPPFAIDFHVHTSFSYDCLMAPNLVIEIARLRGLGGIAVTD